MENHPPVLDLGYVSDLLRERTGDMGALGDPRVVSHWLSCFEAASSQFTVEDRSIPDVRETMGHRLRPRAVVPGPFHARNIGCVSERGL